MKIQNLIHILLVTFCFTFLQRAQAVVPAPDGGYPGGNTAEGDGALFSLTTGLSNTATGMGALFRNTTGNANTANGVNALFHNTTGGANTANGFGALENNTTGSQNTANGLEALFHNTTGSNNTANGIFALFSNTTGSSNTANGLNALESNTTGSSNTANGVNALFNNTTGSTNTADGFQALLNNTGETNIAVGYLAGQNLTTGNCNIDIGNRGQPGESNTLRIGQTVEGCGQTATFVAGIYGTPISSGVPVVVNASGQLGISALTSLSPGAPSPRRFKQEILRYEAMNTKLRSEFLKEHRKVEEQQATITELKKGMKAVIARLNEQASQIQKVSAQLELNKPAPRTVNNNQ